MCDTSMGTAISNFVLTKEQQKIFDAIAEQNMKVLEYLVKEHRAGRKPKCTGIKDIPNPFLELKPA